MKQNNDFAIFVVRVFAGLLFLVPGIYKLFVPGDFIGFLQGPFPQGIILPLFYSVTVFEIVASICLIVGYRAKWVALPLAGILLVALVTVILPDTGNKLYLINLLFHIFGIGVLSSFVWFGPGKYSFRS